MAGYICPLCSRDMGDETPVLVAYKEQQMISMIRKRRPGWVESEGVCKRCFDNYRRLSGGLV